MRSGFLTILCIISWFAYGLGERWVVAQESVAQAQVESCEILSEFRQDILAVTDAHDRTRTTFNDWLNGSATIEDVTLAIASQGEKVESLRLKVK
jgi:hypothetical protein